MPKQNQPKEEKREKGTAQAVIREILSWVIPFVIALAVAMFLKNYIIINADVPTGSMENTIMPGDRLIGNRLAYRSKSPERGDIVIFRYPDNEEELYVKRVIGLPGDTIAIEDGADTPLDEDYLKEDWTVATGNYHFEVPEDSYLMLGDNRNDSWDARYWTNPYVREDKILGKAAVIYWPVHDIGKLE